MERALSTEERIRKAEEIYNRRRGNNTSISDKTENNKISIYLTKKMILQILVCLIIYSAFYLIKNAHYIFSDAVIDKTSEILRYNLDFEKIYNTSLGFIQNNMNIFNTKKDNEEEIENTTNEVKTNGIGGGDKEEKKSDEKDSEKTNKTSKVKKSQMEIDAEYVKDNIKMIKPLNGIITSRFRKKRGKRNSIRKPLWYRYWSRDRNCYQISYGWSGYAGFG